MTSVTITALRVQGLVQRLHHLQGDGKCSECSVSKDLAGGRHGPFFKVITGQTLGQPEPTTETLRHDSQ